MASGPWSSPTASSPARSFGSGCATITAAHSSPSPSHNRPPEPALVGRLARASVFLMGSSMTRWYAVRERGGAADGMTVTGPPPPPPALAVPDEGRGLPVPVAGRLLEPGADLGRAARLLPLERPALEDALDRLGHVQPAAAQGRVERHDAVPAQPQHPLGRLVAGEVVPHQEDAQRRESLGQGEAYRQTLLPGL